jgi:heme-degrading monooxygenase HmoA
MRSSNIETAKTRWKDVSHRFIENPGINWLSLYEVSLSFYQVSGIGDIKKEVPVGYQLVSIMACEDLAQYKQCKKAKGLNKLSELVTGEETVCQTHYAEGTVQFDTKNILLINPFEISADQIEPCLKMWHAACKVIVKDKGFIGVNFLKAIDPESKFKFINIAEWRSKNDIISAHEDPHYEEHRQRGSEYKKHPSLCVHVDTIRSARSAYEN